MCYLSWIYTIFVYICHGSKCTIILFILMKNTIFDCQLNRDKYDKCHLNASGIFITFISTQTYFFTQCSTSYFDYSAFEHCRFQLISSKSSNAKGRVLVLLQVSRKYQRDTMFQNHMVKIAMMRQLLPIKVPTSIKGGCLHSTRKTFC